MTVAKKDQEDAPIVCSPLYTVPEAGRRLDEALHVEMGLAHKYLDVAGVLILVIDSNLRVSFINKKGCEILGYPEDEILGRNWFEDFLPERSRVQVLAVAGSLFAGDLEPMEYFENPVLRKDGTERLLAWHNSYLRNNDGQIVAILTSGEDITERKKLEELLVRAKEEWEEAFDTINDAITIHDKDFNIIRANRAAENMLGVPLKKILSQKCFFSYHGTGCPPDGCPSCLSLKNGNPSVTEIFEPHLGKYLEIKALPRLDKDRQITGLVHIVKDIDAHKKAEETKKQLESQLLQAQKMEAIGTLAGGIAHDFNNILGIILGYTDLAIEETPEESQVRKDLAQVRKATERAKDLVNQILAFSRKTEKEFIPLRVQYIAKETIKMLRASIPTSVELRQHIDSQCSTVMADPTSIHQVLMNLCTNAVHAMQEKGVLEIRLEEITLRKSDLAHRPNMVPGTFVRLSVSDTGIGMNKQTLERIFDPFFTTKKAGQGTGMGLAVVHGIVESLGGLLNVDSKPGRGSTFQVFFPAVDMKEEIPFPSLQPLLTGNERILFVDDEEMMTEMGSHSLKRLGYKLTAKTDSTEALALFRAHPDEFDLVITDQTMPNLTGVELAREILRIKPDMPIILCTGYSSQISEEQALAFGIREFVMKPVDSKTLGQIVHRTLQKNIPAQGEN